MRPAAPRVYQAYLTDNNFTLSELLVDEVEGLPGKMRYIMEVVFCVQQPWGCNLNPISCFDLDVGVTLHSLRPTSATLMQGCLSDDC